ncbi:MAG: asparagine synthase-related protein [Candidatus Humimicrobiaceae bacterium]
MSGIAGVITKNKNNDKNKVQRMLDKISHRGTKAGNLINVDGNILGIISHYDIDHNCPILLDGRIYNIDSLLSKYGLKANGKETDVEKLGILLNEIGPDIVKELKGPFAFMGFDKDKNFYLARDLIGRKPLYYYLDKNSDRIIFASEIKSLLQLTDKAVEFPPGHIMKNFGKPKEISQIQKEGFEILEDSETEDVVRKLEDYMLKAVEKRINENSDLGVWLSGGVDSSIIAALVKEFKEEVHTFSVGFENSPDLISSRKVAKALGTKHKEHLLDLDELFDAIPEVIYHLESFDAPLVRSSLGNMIAAKLSSKADIVFSGEGGDEVFAGYNYFFDFDSANTIQEELVKAINSLHNTALQRVDRLANAHSVTVRLPMLDENLINFAMTIPTSKKIKRNENISKYVLRRVAEKYLPDDIAWRAKEKFWEGSGIQDTLTEKIEENISDSEFSQNRKLENGFVLRNKEEMYYYKIFRKFFPNVNIDHILSFTGDFEQE